jgi:hypothetical protein
MIHKLIRNLPMFARLIGQKFSQQYGPNLPLKEFGQKILVPP